MPLFEFDQDRNPWLPRAEYYVQISSGRTRRRDLENIGRRDSRWPVPQIPDESQFAVHLPTEMMQLGDHHSSSKPTLSLSAHNISQQTQPARDESIRDCPCSHQQCSCSFPGNAQVPIQKGLRRPKFVLRYRRQICLGFSLHPAFVAASSLVGACCLFSLR